MEAKSYHFIPLFKYLNVLFALHEGRYLCNKLSQIYTMMLFLFTNQNIITEVFSIDVDFFYKINIVNDDIMSLSN